ncbi:hypothetical protein SmJEL517_g05855 [Synchytrium microbalum]|uniref:Uncharacterized protein n=1 Tax=Synchytrium microbalum TaxID=1806994 RepID=A0A507BXV3_9FUNG|nr:uncharacterized protein SmJEL517_g05855 [Synchytrium microbalum]TPX30624.1 hypothetical protein SmJEL517_g05855 [Synchytrium microbalum]
MDSVMEDAPALKPLEEEGNISSSSASAALANDNDESKPILEVTTRNGENYRVNDHVYLASELPQEPFLTGRIMEFVQAKASNAMMVRVGWFYRPRDVIFGGRRKHYDAKLLVASQHSDLNPVASIRGICQIRHLNHIPDLEKFKAQDDCFYFHQLYDRYTHRLYDVVPVEECQHLPPSVQEKLIDVPYILVEAGKANFFTDRRACQACSKWCETSDCIRCAHCGESYHLVCLEMERKLPKGFAWQCHKCLRAAKLAKNGSVSGNATDDTVTTVTSTSAASSVPASPVLRNGLSNHLDTAEYMLPANGIDSATSTSSTPKKPVTPYKHIWPFHYLGDYSRLEATDDDEQDKGFPKARSRVGKGYQAEIPTFGDEAETEEETSRSAPQRGGYRRKKQAPKKVMQDDVDSTVERGISDVRIFMPDKLPSDELDTYLQEAVKLFPKSTDPASPDAIHPKSMDVADRALEVLHRSNWIPKDALKIMSKLTLADVRVADWSEEEVKKFEDGIVKYGHDLHWIQKEVWTKTMKEVVIFFYKWKRSERYRPVYSQFCEKYRPGKVFKDLQRRVPPSEVEEEDRADASSEGSSDLSELSVSDSDDDDEKRAARKLRECSNCLTHKSMKWRVRQLYGRSEMMCSECTDYWLKYAGTRPVTETVKKHNREKYAPAPKPLPAIIIKPIQAPTPKRKREDEPLQPVQQQQQAAPPMPAIPKITVKKPKPPPAKVEPPKPISLVPDSVLEEPTDPPPAQPVPCGVCREWSNHPNNPLVACIKCHLRVHPSCYGIPDNHIVPALQRWACSRCMNNANPDSSLNYTCVMCPTQLNAFDCAIKKTIGKNWVHVACAVWTPEVRFSNLVAMEPIEGVGLVDRSRWNQPCVICHQHYGTCVTCFEPGCTKSFHVTCGQIAGFDLTFEEERRAANGGTAPVTKRQLHAEVYCNEHRRNPYINFSLPSSTLPTLPYNANAPPETRSTMLKEYVMANKGGKSEGTLGQRRALASAVRAQCTCHLVTGPHTHNNVNSNGTEPSTTSQATPAIESLPPPIPITMGVSAPDPVGGRRTCIRCETGISPIWWMEEEALNPGSDLIEYRPDGPIPSGKRVCHTCYWKIRDELALKDGGSKNNSNNNKMKNKIVIAIAPVTATLTATTEIVTPAPAATTQPEQAIMASSSSLSSANNAMEVER